MSKKYKNDPYNNKIYEECKGCKIIKNCNLQPRFEYNGIMKECPCATCLVKGICSSICKRLDIYGDLCEFYNNLSSDSKDDNDENEHCNNF